MTDTLNARKVEELTGYLMAIPMTEQANVVNYVATEYDYPGDYVYNSVEDLVEGFLPIDAVRAVYFGKLDSWNDYVQLDGYGNVKSWYGLDEYDAKDLAKILLEHDKVIFDYYLHMADGGMVVIDDPDNSEEELASHNEVRGTAYTVADITDIEPDVVGIRIN